jgi:hypothetical protein
MLNCPLGQKKKKCLTGKKKKPLVCGGVKMGRLAAADFSARG